MDAPDNPALIFYHNYISSSQARQAYEKLLRTQAQPPAYNFFRYDRQQNNIYRWEGDCLQSQEHKMDVKEMTRICGQLSHLFNMKAPIIDYKDKPNKEVFAIAELDNNTIRLHRPYLYALLHEVAHFVNDRVNKDHWAHHGPGFVRTYLSILSLFPELGDAQELEDKARAHDIEIAPADQVPSCAISENARPFKRQP